MIKNYKAYTINNFNEISQINLLSDEQKRTIKVVGTVLPFKVNNYVLDELIDWSNIPNDPIFQLSFPQKGMLSDKDFKETESALKENNKEKLNLVINKIRLSLNPNPDGQESNTPIVNGIKLNGIQHKYNETMLFFPSHCLSCHAYCSFCFRWPQFSGINEFKFNKQNEYLLTEYLSQRKEITDILLTGGDPMVMSANKLSEYIDFFINKKFPNLQTIRIGTKSLSFWPYRFVSDKDSDDILRLFEKIIKQGYNLSIMAHFNHYKELETEIVEKAIKRIRNTGAQIRTQSPILKHINDNAEIWRQMWKKQVKMGCIPYYMFVARDTGAQNYFAVPLSKTWEIYKDAYQKVSGICRTARGPSMSSNPGKIQILGINEIMGEKVFALQFIQGRNADWVRKPFFAKYNKDAIWIDDLKPSFNEKKFFFED